MSIIVTKADGTTDVTFTLTGVTGAQQVFTNVAAGPSEPESFRVQHWMRPIGAKGTDRHEIAIQKGIVEDTTNQFLVQSTTLKLAIPRSSEITLAMVKDQVAMLNSYVQRSSNLSALMNGVTPEGDFNVTGPFNPTLA